MLMIVDYLIPKCDSWMLRKDSMTDTYSIEYVENFESILDYQELFGNEGDDSNVALANTLSWIVGREKQTQGLI